MPCPGRGVEVRKRRRRRGERPSLSSSSSSSSSLSPPNCLSSSPSAFLSSSSVSIAKVGAPTELPDAAFVAVALPVTTARPSPLLAPEAGVESSSSRSSSEKAFYLRIVRGREKNRSRCCCFSRRRAQHRAPRRRPLARRREAPHRCCAGASVPFRSPGGGRESRFLNFRDCFNFSTSPFCSPLTLIVPPFSSPSNYLSLCFYRPTSPSPPHSR